MNRHSTDLWCVLTRKIKTKKARTKWDEMDIGPFQAYGIETRRGGKLWRPALKGLNIKLGPNASVCFDTERMRMAVAWTGGFLRLPAGRDGLEGVPKIDGTIAISTPMTPGWAGPKGEWVEPSPPTRKGGDIYSMGPLPQEWASWHGHYTYGNLIVLSYSVGASDVLELPGFTNGIFTRQIEITRSPAKSPMSLMVCEVADAKEFVEGNVATLEKDGVITGAAVIGTGVKLKIQNGRIIAEVKSLLPTAQFHIGIWNGPKEEVGKLLQFSKKKIKARALTDLTKGGKPKWEQTVTTRGRLGLTPGAYVVDTIAAPENNPWKSWIRCSGFDFFKDGTTAAVCSVTGDVWVVSGIDDGLKEFMEKKSKFLCMYL